MSLIILQLFLFDTTVYTYDIMDIVGDSFDGFLYVSFYDIYLVLCLDSHFISSRGRNTRLVTRDVLVF